MKLKVLLFFGGLIHCQFSILDQEPDPNPEETYRLIGQIIGSYHKNKNWVTKATPESSYQNNRYVFNYRVSAASDGTGTKNVQVRRDRDLVLFWLCKLTPFDCRCGLLPNFEEKLIDYYKAADLENLNGENRPYDKNCLTVRVSRWYVFRFFTS